jgi:hypothetical protein
VDVEAKLAPAVSALCDDLAKRNPDGKEITVATVPLVDAEQGIPKLGVVAAQIVERRILSSKPEWLRVQSRINLMSIMEEQKLWITDMVKASSRNNSAPAGFLEKADFLVVGVVTPGSDEVTFELRLIGTRNGNVVNAQTVSVPTSPAIRTLLRQMRRQEGKASTEVAPVENIRVAMTAQRPGAPGMPVKEWAVTEGETLRGGSDQFNFRFSVDADACIYVFLFGSDQQAALLFPGDDWDVQFERQFRRKARKQDNYCRAEAEYTIPGPEASGQPRFFKLDTTPGSNTLYVCASRTETRNTQDIVDQLTRAGSEKDRMKLLTESIKFDCVTTFSFKQDDGKQAEVRPASPGRP